MKIFDWFLLQDGVVLVHCNAGVSRAAAIVIGFLMNSEEMSFTSAFSLVKNARPSICPNAGFMEQLRTYQEGKECNECDNIQELEKGDSSWVTFQQITHNCNFWIGHRWPQPPVPFLKSRLVNTSFCLAFFKGKWSLIDCLELLNKYIFKLYHVFLGIIMLDWMPFVLLRENNVLQ